MAGRRWVGPAALGALSLLVLALGLMRSSWLISTDHVRVVTVSRAAARPEPPARPEPRARPRAEPARAAEGADAVLARVEAELAAFHAGAWQTRTDRCTIGAQARYAFDGLAARVRAAANETLRHEATKPRWLSRAQLARHASADGVVFVTWANAHFVDFVRNWALSLERLGLRNYVVGALDDGLLAALAEPGSGVAASHTFRMLADEALEAGASQHWTWGSPLFNQMGRHKGVLMRSALAMGFTIVLCDVDTVWLRDPLPFFARYPAAELLITSDHLRPSLRNHSAPAPYAYEDGGLEDALADVGRVQFAQLMLLHQNIGVMLLRPTLGMRLFVEVYMERLEAARQGQWDQSVFGEILRQGFSLQSLQMAGTDPRAALGPQPWQVEPPMVAGTVLPRARADRSVAMLCGLLSVGWLPIATFAHGHGYWVSRLQELAGGAAHLQPYVVHNTYQYWGASGKRMRFREAGLWHVDTPERFSLERPARAPAGEATGGLHAPWALASPAARGEYALAADGGGGLLRAVAYVPAAAFETVDVFEPSHAASELPVAHAALVQAQLAGAAGALALARALRRALELPSLVCSCDRTFLVAWNCTFWPAPLQRPFRCPSDHAYALGEWDGLRLPYRAPGFWDGAAEVGSGAAEVGSGAVEAAAWPRAGEVRVHVCGARPTAALPASPSLAAYAQSARPPTGGALAARLAARCAAAEQAAAADPGGVVGAFAAANALAAALGAGAAPADASALLPRGLTDASIAAVLAPFARAPSLALDSTDGVFGGWAERRNAASFRELFEGRLGMDWCCFPGGGFKFNWTVAQSCATPSQVVIALRDARNTKSNARFTHCEGAAGPPVAPAYTGPR